MEPTLFEPSRRPGDPPICLTANRPAFDSQADSAAYLAANCPGAQIDVIWKCDACGKFHHRAHFPGRFDTLIIPLEVRKHLADAAPRRLKEALAAMGHKTDLPKVKDKASLFA